MIGYLVGLLITSANFCLIFKSASVDYYIHRNERSEMRKKDPEFKKVWDALNAIRTNIRIDHLNSVL